MTVPTNWEEAITEILIRFGVSMAEYANFGSPFNSDEDNIAGAEALYQTSLEQAKQAINQAVKDHIIGEPLSADECRQLTMNEKAGRYMSDGSRLTIDMQNERLNTKGNE